MFLDRGQGALLAGFEEVTTLQVTTDILGGMGLEEGYNIEKRE